MSEMDARIDNAMKEFELRKKAMIKAGEGMHAARVSTCTTDNEPRSEPGPHPLPDPDMGTDMLDGPKLVLAAIRHFQGQMAPRYVAALTFAALVAPTAAMDQQLVLGSGPFAFPEAVGPHQIPPIAIGTCTGMLFLWGGYFMGAAKSVVGPMMGITSVLYFMMRNDEAVKPVLAWAYVMIISRFAWH